MDERRRWRRPRTPPPTSTVVDADERSDVERERDEYLDALQRLQADFENYRKRVARPPRTPPRARRATSSRSCCRCSTPSTSPQAHFATRRVRRGARPSTQARGLLLDTLAKEGLERIDEVGVAFDPQVHDAVAHVEGEATDQVVDEVLRAGYRWKGAVLRPAMVRVKG